MRKILLVLAIVSCAAACFAQSSLPVEDQVIEVDVVHLKFGTTTQGFIIENVPGDHIILVNNDGVKLTYTYDVIERMDKKKIKLISLTWKHLMRLSRITVKTGESYDGTIVSKEPDGSCVFLTKDQQIKTITGAEIVSVEDITPTITMAQYEKMKKNAWTAYFLDAIPGLALGHLYAGNWGRGLTYELSMAALIGVCALSGAAGAYFLIGVIVLDIVQAFDAFWSVEKRNQQLLEMVRDPDVGLLYRQNGEVNEFGVSLKF